MIRLATTVARRALVPIHLVAGIVLTWSGAHKASAPAEFAEVLEAHGLLSGPRTVAAAWSVIAVEVALGVACVAAAVSTPRARSFASWAIAALFVAFAAYAAILHAHPPPKPVVCGCPLQSAPVRDWSGVMLRHGAVAGAFALLAALGGRDTRS